MKFLATKKGKIWTAVILVLALLLGILVYRFLHPTKVTDALIKRIEYEYAIYKTVMFGIRYGAIYSPAPIEFCYGIFDGCIPVTFYLSAAFDSHEITVAGCTFHFQSSNFFFVWRNGQFCFIEEAYERGWLTAEQVAEIADIHNNIYNKHDYSVGDQYWIRHGQE